MSSIHIDASQVEELAVDLTEARGRIQRSAPELMASSARRIARIMREDFNGHRHLGGLGDKVATDRLDGIGLHYEVGIDKGGVGDLGNIAAYGTINNAPLADKNRGLDMESPRIADKLGDAGEDAVLGGAE